MMPAGVSGPTTNSDDLAQANAMRSAAGTSAACESDSLPACEIENGVQKYVLIEVGRGSSVRHLVRGKVSASYHKDAARAAVNDLQDMMVPYKVLGGGRIDYKAQEKTALVYGFSYGFPWEGAFRHDISANVIKTALPDVEVSVSDEGY
eukprot:Rhum_TRINITY_DN9683_c0_g3::Rhum_TRINITY_DN9683_c0_g3_i1::g.34641::m.34641/K01112/PHPT1; phosphohistidine phosphatase